MIDTLTSARLMLEGGSHTPEFDKIQLRKDRRQTVNTDNKFGSNFLRINNESSAGEEFNPYNDDPNDDKYEPKGRFA